MNRFIGFAFAFCVLSVNASVPCLQPGVKEYVAGEGCYAVAGKVAVFDDNAQCRIGAYEVPGLSDRRVWNGALPECGIMIAVEGSTFGKSLVNRFGLKIPEHEQGYAIAVTEKSVAIVGRDPIGALYGCATFRQLAQSDSVLACTIRDWPDFRYHGEVSIGRGLWFFGAGKDLPGRFEAMRRAVDELVRHKVNLAGDLFRVRANTTEEELKEWRSFLAYMRERGIRLHLYSTMAIWDRDVHPKSVSLKNWRCVVGHRASYDHYHCWSDDAAIRASAERYADFLVRIGARDALVTMHPADDGGVEDPENWSRRCEACRRRWKDDERWAATANIINIWGDVFKRRLPKVSLGSCIYPYWISWLKRPFEERSQLWKQNVTEYWRLLDKAIEDKDFWFSSWAATPAQLREYRTYVPSRPIHISDPYPQNAGVFSTCHRKIGTLNGDNIERSTPAGGDQNLPEACFLAAEYAWDANAPGKEIYDGGVYYNPLTDQTGPDMVITNSLVRICRTFWGDRFAPYMVRILSSGVMPRYIEDPESTVRHWRRRFANPDYDPSSKHGRKFARESLLAVDDASFLRSQLTAAECCENAVAEAVPTAMDLKDPVRRRYFAYFAKRAPLWTACARVRLALREAKELKSKGLREEACELLRRARKRCIDDYRKAEESPFAKEIDFRSDISHDDKMLRSDIWLNMIDAELESGRPRFRVGILSDTHITNDPASLGLVQKAMVLFSRENVDVICHLGDLADFYAPKGFVHYRRAVEDAFAGNMPLTFYAFGGHDRNRYRCRKEDADRETAVWEIMRKALKASHGLYDVVEFKGYPFVIVQEYMDVKRAEKLLKGAIDRYPDKPVFLLYHEPAMSTTESSAGWGNWAIRRICDRYPRVVLLSGHTHGSVRNELMIWQEGFTAINGGCLYKWLGPVANIDYKLRMKHDDGVIVMDVNSDSLVFHRYSVMTGLEYNKENPWRVPLPFYVKDAPYRKDVRQAHSPIPQWRDGAQLETDWTREMLKVAFPPANHRIGIYRNIVKITDSNGQTVTMASDAGEFWRVSNNVNRCEFSFSIDYFSPGSKLSVSAWAEGFFGNRSDELKVDTRMPRWCSPGRLLWQTEDAFQDLSVRYGSRKGREQPVTLDKDGWLCVTGRVFRVDLPVHVFPATDLPGQKYSVLLTLEDQRSKGGCWRIELVDSRTFRPLVAERINTMEGTVGRTTYRLALTKKDAGILPVTVSFTYGGPWSRIKLSGVQVRSIR